MDKGILDGKWQHGVFTIIVKGYAYKSFYNGFRYGKGKIVYKNEKFTLTSTHARKYIWWIPFEEIVNGKYTIIGDIVTIISCINGRYSNVNGRWVRIK